MPTPIWLTGFEHGVLSLNGGGLFDLVGGAPTVQSANVRTGSYALECAPAAAACRAGKNYSARNDVVWRFYVRLSSLPSANCILASIATTDGVTGNLNFRLSDGKITIENGGATSAGPVVTAGVWYRIDISGVFNTNPRTMDAQVDGVAMTQATNAIAGTTTTGVRFGTPSAHTFVAQYDDAMISHTIADYPIGAGQTVGLSPNSDGTHNAGVNVMEDAAGVDIGTTPAWSLLDDVPLSTGGAADRVQQTANGTANYAEVNFANMPAASAINGVMGLLAYQSATATANTGTTVASADAWATNTSIYGTIATPADMSEASEFYKSAVIDAPGGSWSEAEVNALQMRIGYSSDAAPDPYWDALMAEVDYVPVERKTKSVLPVHRRAPVHHLNI